MIRVGTCSWAEKTLVESGEFYPREVRSAEARLRYYASCFDTVEVDSTYYAIPEQRTVWLWGARTPGAFTFHVKAYGALTGHAIDPRTLPADIRGAAGGPSGKSVYVKEREALRLIARAVQGSPHAARPGGEAGRYRLPVPPMVRLQERQHGLCALLQAVDGGLSLAVEFRHGSWLSGAKAPEVLAFLREHAITYIAADEPQYGTSATVPFVPFVTTDTAYFRFHGRNGENWLKKGIATSLRYAYTYSDAELREFVPAVKEADRQAKKTYAMFNNCHRGSATANAARLKELLQEGKGA